MTRKCSVKSCTNSKRKPNTALFKVPANSYHKWNEIIAKVNGDSKRKVTYVCAEHFTEKDLITSYASLPKDLEHVVGKRDKYGLKKGAVPSLFKSLIVTSNNGNVTTVFPKLSSTVKSTKLPERLEVSYEQLNKDKSEILPLQEMLESLKKILLPIGWMLYSDGNTMIMYKPVKTVVGCIQMIIEKQIVCQFDTSHIDYYVNGKCRSPASLGLNHLTYPLNLTEITYTVRKFDYLRICAGGPSINDFPGISVKKTHIEGTIWRHDDCHIVSLSKKRCKRCNSLILYFPICMKRSLLKNKSLTQSCKQNKISRKQKLLEDIKINETL